MVGWMRILQAWLFHLYGVDVYISVQEADAIQTLFWYAIYVLTPVKFWGYINNKLINVKANNTFIAYITLAKERQTVVCSP